MTSVFIIAVSDVVRAGLESLITSDARFTVTGSAVNLSELLARGMEEAVPDIVIFETQEHWEETITGLRAFIDETNESDELPAFVIIGNEQIEPLREALQTGIVRAMLPGAASSGEIIAALEAVSAGLVALDTEMFASLLAPSASNINESQHTSADNERLLSIESGLDALTPREREVLKMLAEGLSNKEIAWRMKISEHTVKFHVASIFAKLKVSTRTEAVMQGIRQGLVLL